MKYLPILAWLASMATLQGAMAAEPPETPPTEAAAPLAKKTAPLAEPQKKTEYDKLPFTQLLAKANANDPTAQFELASRHNYGRGLPKNTTEALRWLRKAAMGGHQDAARLLAIKFYEGHDVTPDHAEAMQWTRVLAESGDVPAQLMLANMYANGEGTQRDLVRAYMWYAIAAVGGKPDVGSEQPNLERVQFAAMERDKLAKLLTEEQEVEAQRLASEWWRQKYAIPKKPKKANPGNASR
ncbi:MAG: sel1 repeat family protein [Methylophilaceae bacterium]|nr:sel1 repeat family protein [Methylophilaceae bacterium]